MSFERQLLEIPTHRIKFGTRHSLDSQIVMDVYLKQAQKNSDN